jgi:hypothetical protein
MTLIGALIEGVRFATDSPLEGEGFEPSVASEISDAFESAGDRTACAATRRSCSSPRRPAWVRALDLGSAFPALGRN